MIKATRLRSFRISLRLKTSKKASNPQFRYGSGTEAPEVEVTMSSRFTLTIAFAIVSAFVAGCTHRAEFLGIEVPASATSVEFLHPAPNDTGVRFVLQAQPSSYQYVNKIRDQIKSDGYNLCRKSAISTWQPLPERDGSQAYQNNSWLVEMYATRDKNKFVLLRVDQNINSNSQNATQKFLIASETIGSGKPKLSNINEFCDV